jgi:hypothetical protein
MKMFLTTLVFLSFIGHVEAKDKLKGSYLYELTGTLGFRGVSLTDSAKVTGGSYSGSAIQAGLEFPFYKTTSKTYFIKGSSPLVSEIGTGLYSGSIGVNFYFDKLSGAYQITDNSSTLTVRPSMQYYWGLDIGGGSMIYTIEDAKKNDFVLLLGAHAGLAKQWNESWSLKGNLGVDRGFGINTVLFTYYLDLGVTYQF